MEEFYPGDKVEFISDKTQGVVVSIPDSQTLIIDLGGGLEIPVGKNEVIKLTKIETERKRPSLLEELKAEKAEPETEGLFLALYTNEALSVHEIIVLNTLKEPAFFAFYRQYGNNYAGISKGELKKNDFISVLKVNFKENSNQSFLLQFMPFLPESAKRPEIIEYNFRLDKELTRNEKRFSKILKKEAVFITLFELKNAVPVVIIEPEPKPVIDIEVPEIIIDLHIDKINPAHKLMSPAEKYDFQFTYFVNALEKGIALNFKSMIFIHGIGVSSLKNRITEYLKDHEHIKSFGDADVRKYGYGATKVEFE